MACEHAWSHQPPTKGGSGVEVFVCKSCGERRVEGRMGSPASYMSPDLFDRLKEEHPDLFERWVSQPARDRAKRRDAARRLMEDRGNGRAAR